MKKKKLLSSLIIVLITLFFVLSVFTQNTSPENNKQKTILLSENTFTNDFFSTDIAIDDISEELVRFQDIHLIVEEKMITSYPTKAARDLAIKNEIANLVANKRVGIATAEELYYFSVDCSYNWKNPADAENYPYLNTIEYLLSLDYVLLDDIDYSKMRARKFVPIGIDMIIPEEQPLHYDYPFTGSFDGQGFTVSNLYLADYSYVYATYRFDGADETDIDLPLNIYYSMFATVGINGKICNLQIYNPIYELLEAPEDLTNTAVLVGENNGLIYNVAVIDQRVSSVGEDISGIRFYVQFPSSAQVFTAAGFVHTNQATGKIYNSYYVSKNVLAPSSKFRFDVKPFVYNNEGDIHGGAYNEIVEAAVDSTSQPTGVCSYTSAELQSGWHLADPEDPIEEPININDVDFSTVNYRGVPLEEDRQWQFYAYDGFPNLFALEYDMVNNCFLIENDYDFIAFNRLINLNTTYLDLPYNRHTYQLVNNIDMKNITAYQTPHKDFKGILKGGEGNLIDGPNNNKYIFNLKIFKHYVAGNNLYLGLFSTLSGTVTNINFYNCHVQLQDNSDYYGRTFYVGGISAHLEAGEIKNIITATNIDLGNEAIGKTYCGGIAGNGSGTVEYVANTGNVDGGIHDFSKVTVEAAYCIGGIIGSSAGENLILKNAINKGNIVGVGSAATFSVGSGNVVNIKVGGIIAEINNETATGNSLYYVTNTGTIKGGAFAGNGSAPVYQNLGGIFASHTGYSNRISTDNETYRNGRWENTGTLEAAFLNAETFYYAAGIGIAESTETKAEFSYMTNSGGYDFTGFNMGTDNRNFYYASTLIDNSAGGIKLSRAYNEKNYSYDSSYFSNPQGLTLTSIKIAPFFVSITDKASELVYCQNNGSITVGNTAADTAVPVEMKIAGISLANKIDYDNVYMVGDITATKITQNTAVYVAGIAWVLSYDTDLNYAYQAQNCLNEGKIITADFNGDTEITETIGTAQSASTFSSTLIPRNLYVAGLININVGEIRNLVNRGNLTATYNKNVKDITGTGNAYVGGIVTFNYNLIQDCANFGDIEYTNSSDSAIAYVTGGVTPDYGSRFGGLIFAFKGGLVLGGVTCAFGDTAGTALAGYGKGADVKAKILDTANHGNVYGKAKEYVRCGGILGVALGTELTAGTDSNTSAGKTAVFSTSITGAEDTIANCLLSNGLNFGTVFAVTQTIGQYSGSVGNGGEDTNFANSQRPGIHAGAGGVIGYGLCKMKRMLNHGVVAATDVAGGIVGATYILGGTSSSYNVTIVDIDTAVHYGKVKALKCTAYSGITYSLINDYNNSTYFYPDNDTVFVFPASSYNLSLYPNRKRGFGGIFGRLQRGGYGLMQSSNFINIMNMDPSVDMVGRADQSSYGSYFYFRFKVRDVDDTYYTARTNDTTPACMVGFISGNYSGSLYEYCNQVTFRIYRTGLWRYTYQVNQVTISGGDGGDVTGKVRRVGIYLENPIQSEVQLEENTTAYTIDTYDAFTGQNEVYNANNAALGLYGLKVEDVSGLPYSGGYADLTYTDYSKPVRNFNITGVLNQYSIEKITDDPNSQTATYIFDEDFPLMNPQQSDYIYPVDNAVLADRFRQEEPSDYKMYVLATTAGREKGAVLPANIRIDRLYKLDESQADFIDLSDIPPECLIIDAALITDYRKLFQIRFNDRSLILPQEETPTLADIILYDPLNKSPALQGGTIDNINHTITFTLSKDAFSQSNVTYQVLSANLSEKAVIACSGITPDNHAGFYSAYEVRAGNILTDNYASIISGTIIVGDTLVFTDKITVYSEIAANVAALVTTYYTDYTVIINCTSDGFAMSLDEVLIDGVNATVPGLVNNTYTVTSHQLSPGGTADFIFYDNHNQLPLGHQLTFNGLFLGATEIGNAYYQYQLAGVDENSYFSLSITLSNQLKAGTYTAKFKYYHNLVEYGLVFTKDSSGLYQVIGVDYTTYSNDAEGKITEFAPTDNDFKTYIRFGIVIEDIPRYPATTAPTVNRISKAEAPTYIDDTSYYEIIINNAVIARITVA
ncbi:MAG: hypothetical protein PHN29_05520, partial [Endomicrobiaceae bacterium]|nr:hypothetical protein [Endomicrobiaceae bacterium]